MTKDKMNELLLAICAVVLEVDPYELGPNEEWAVWGVDSLAAAMIHNLVESLLVREGCAFPLTDFLTIETVDQLSSVLIEKNLVREILPSADFIKDLVKDRDLNGKPENKEPEGPSRKSSVKSDFNSKKKPAAGPDCVFSFRELCFSVPGHRTALGGKPIISFASNDYLSFATDAAVQAAAVAAVREYGTGCGSSMLGSGSLGLHAALAEDLADFLGKEAVLLMPAGYMAMLGFCATQIIAGHCLFSDALNHRSIIDGLRLGKGAAERKDAFYFFNHNSVRSLKQIRAVVGDGKASPLPNILVTEGVFSMDGDRAVLDELVPYCKNNGMAIAIDDAHGIGVCGDQGRGTADAFGKTDEVDYILGTFSKSFAASGGFIAASKEAVDALRQQSSPYMFSASLSPAAAATVRHILGVLSKDDRRVKKLWENISYFQSCALDLDLPVMASDSAIFPVQVSREKEAMDCAHRLLAEKGIFVLPVIYPVVPKNKARLRVSINAGHSREDIHRLAESLAEILASDHG